MQISRLGILYNNNANGKNKLYSNIISTKYDHNPFGNYVIFTYK